MPKPLSRLWIRNGCSTAAMVREGILNAGACGWPSETEDAEGDAALMRASVSSTSFRSSKDMLRFGSRAEESAKQGSWME